ncbi:MAG TPA: epoxyqueuosine reductase QueH [Clostridia bacterium]|mgnify:CR=1 FL=1|nr:epoxyqueuosine reductase QueH [Clostridia bacterium]
MTENYSKELEKITKNLNGKPALLLHSCCAPCSSYCLEYLSKSFEITVLYYNPNIDSEEEFFLRSAEQQRLIDEMHFENAVKLIVEPYNAREYYSVVKGLENEREGGVRCAKCFKLRLEKTAKKAKELSFDYFTTTLTISPLKNAELINDIGFAAAKKHGVNWLPSDFKKKNGYLRSIELSKEFGLYRQNYCGCVFSKNEKTPKN